MLTDTIKQTGDVHICVRNTQTGEIIEDKWITNLVVTTGKQFIASRMSGATSDVMGWIAVGTDNTAANIADTTLGTEITRVATTVSGGTASNNSVTYEAVFPVGTGTGALVEAGIFNDSSVGTMLSRTVFSVVNKGAADEMTISWIITVG